MNSAEKITTIAMEEKELAKAYRLKDISEQAKRDKKWISTKT